MVFLWHEIHVSKITMMSSFLLSSLIIHNSHIMLLPQDLLKTIQKNQNFKNLQTEFLNQFQAELLF